jgi:hypothetical protein
MKFPFQLRHEQKHQGERAADERRYRELLAKAVQRQDLDDFEGKLLTELAAKLGRNLERDADEESRPYAFLIDGDVRQAENDAWDMYFRGIMVDAHLPQLTPVDKLPYDLRARIEPARIAHESKIRAMDQLEAAMAKDGRPIIKIQQATIGGAAVNLMARYRFVQHERQSPVDFKKALDRLTFHATPMGGKGGN